MPVATMHKIYEIELARLDHLARIETFIPLLIRWRVKELLRSQRSGLSSAARLLAAQREVF